MVLLFGPAGTGGRAIDGLEKAAKLGLKAVEIEFTYGINMSNETAKEVGKVAKKLGISLSIHAPYYINLFSEEKQKIHASIKRIIDSCERGYYLDAKYIIFHAAFYGKQNKEDIYAMVKKRILEIQNIIKEKKWDVILCPETTGKSSQFGDIDELVRLSKETDCGICVDFAHIKARYNEEVDYDNILGKIKDIKFITCHFSGIEFTSKGERKHLITEDKDIKKLIEHLIKHKINTRIINESPDPFGDSIKSLKIYEELK